MKINEKSMTELSDTIRIRAHHILCIQGFQGYGYSDEFVQNMAQIIDHLKSNPHVKVKTIASADDICLYCPHIEQKCNESSNSDEKITIMDWKVINYLGLQEKAKYSYKHLLELLQNNIDFLKLKDICGECSWTESCNLYLKFNNNK